MHYFSGKGCSEFLESMHYCIGILTNTLIVVGAVCCCMFLVLNIICAVGRARHKESMIAEGMTGISFLIKIMCIIFLAVYRLFL